VIYAKFVFRPAAKRQILGRLLALPQELRPTRRSAGEDETGTLVGDVDEFLNEVEKRDTGFFLKGPNVTYDLVFAGKRPITCNCFLEVQPDLAKLLLVSMATVQPIFGFACTWEEMERRNRVVVKQGKNTIESWVGRDTRKYVPGFYWMTLLPAALAEKHDVPLATVEGVALEHVKLDGDQHLFRFYDRPEDWLSDTHVSALATSLPGVFNVEKVKPQLDTAKNFVELEVMLRSWN
jgi:hypothetical protein